MGILLNTAPLTVQEHMALDEQLVRWCPQEVTLRFYRWTNGPAVTFGYAQFFNEVQRTLSAANFSGPFTRRPTGGGVVFHADDLTFSLVFSSSAKSTDIYRRLHAAVFSGLARAGVDGQMYQAHLPASAYAPSVNHQASACFIRPVENDLLAADGQKILGGAIRRFGSTVLYQGSLQLPAARETPALKRAVIDAVRQFLATDLQPALCPPELLEKARQTARDVYDTAAWKEKF